MTTMLPGSSHHTGGQGKAPQTGARRRFFAALHFTKSVSNAKLYRTQLEVYRVQTGSKTMDRLKLQAEKQLDRYQYFVAGQTQLILTINY